MRMPPLRGRATILLTALLAGLLALGASATAATAGTACIDVRGRCYPTLDQAVQSARDGDTVRIPAGRFAGGVTVTSSITLLGAGAKKTVIAGGGPVLTIGTFGAESEPTVGISRVTITGGIAHSSPVSVPFTGQASVIASGGGLEIPPSASFGGATVTISDSVIRGNLVSPERTLSPDVDQEQFWPRCPDAFCPFAGAFGGGIDNWGTLTLLRTAVAGNHAVGALTSDADGGGVFNHGTLTVDHSAITGNHAVAVAPNGRFAEGGGIFSDSHSTLTVERSSVSGNTVRLENGFPYQLPDGTTIDTLANSGGVHVGDDVTVTIDGSAIDDNDLTFISLLGQWGVINSGLQVGLSSLTLHDTSVSRNRLSASVATTADSGPLGGAMEWDYRATITGLRATGNTSTVQSAHGAAGIAATVASLPILEGVDPGPSTMSDSLISGNRVTAISPDGPVSVVGAGLVNDGTLRLDRVVVSNNVGVGQGPTGLLQGGGIWNGAAFGFTPQPPSRLTLSHAIITGNRLTAAPAEGGGLYTEVPVTRSATVIAANRPDQCQGCDLAPAGASTKAGSLRTRPGTRIHTGALGPALVLGPKEKG